MLREETPQHRKLGSLIKILEKIFVEHFMAGVSNTKGTNPCATRECFGVTCRPCSQVSRVFMIAENTLVRFQDRIGRKTKPI